MQKGDSKLNALLFTLIIIVAVWLVWYYETHGSINIIQLLGF
jgi:hypothetical protein